MTSDLSAYAILGLEPGADRASIDEAYRRLIKQYHPDRRGGDADRAADINRAYRELRRPARARADRPAPNDIAEAIYARRAGRSRVPRPVRRRRWWPLVLAGVVGLTYLQWDRLAPALPIMTDAFTRPWTPALGSPDAAPALSSEMLDGPLSEAEIGESIREASSLSADASEEQLAERSRLCHRAMRAQASLAQLDRCAAFDYAVTMVDGRDPVQDKGPFSASAVTARQMAAARLLSNDFLAIEARLDRLRNRVELVVGPNAAMSGSPHAPPGP